MFAFTGIIYLGAVLFLGGLAWRVARWASTPEPFRIPTTSGQQRSVAGIRHSRIESPATPLGVVGRLLLEALLFRSLFRNTVAGRDRAAILPPPVFLERKALWIGALVFHWSLLVIVVRHLRFFVEPVPAAVTALAAVDGWFEIGLPAWYATDAMVTIALAYLLLRRLRDPLLRYISLPADYLALGAVMAVVGTGIGMRYIGRVDLVAVRAYTLGLAAFPAGAGPWPVLAAPGGWLIAHLLTVSFLLAVLPFTKMMHAAGVWLSPTRNQANDTRSRRHVNPWNTPSPHHTYEEWEREFRARLEAAGLPIEKV